MRVQYVKEKYLNEIYFMINMKKISLLVLSVFLLIHGTSAQENKEPVTSKIEGHVFKPAKREATDARVNNLKVPAGFKVQKFAENLGKPRMIAVAENGDVYVTVREKDEVVRLQDTNGDGKADKQETVAQLDQIHGINIYNGKMYLATVTGLYQAQMVPEDGISEPELILDDLPDGGQHPNRTIAFGPDGKLYVSVGSTCNACEETNKEHATILRMNAGGSDRKVFAKGLRNTMGFGWHPETYEMWGMDHGIDWLGDNAQKEELNKIEEGADYGWPYLYGKSNPVPHREPENMTHKEYAKKTKEPVLEHPEAHSAALGMLFYNGTMFPEEYRNDAFVALHGSWNRSKPVGYKVVRIKYKNGQPVRFEDFLTGFLIENGRAQFGRPVAMAIHTDGSLLVTDDENGVVYRIFYQP